MSETGWPSGISPNTQNDRANLQNEQRFWLEFLPAAKQNGISFGGFEAFDERWKENQVPAPSPNPEAHWGLYDENRSPKTLVTSLERIPDHVTDFNLDGNSDIVWRQSGGTVSIWEMTGNQLIAGQNVGTVGTDWRIAGTPDLNGDGRSDVLWRNSVNGTVAGWEMNGFQVLAAQNIAAVGTDWQLAGTPDVNNDGAGDVLWRNTQTGMVAVWEMNGLTIKAAQNVAFMDTSWRIEGTADVNGDGNGDIIWRNSNTGAVTVWEMNGFQASPAPNPLGTVGLDWAVVGVGDFDGDGNRDLLWRNTGTGDVSLWELNGFQVKAAQSIANVSLSLRVAGTPDMNGDGKADILWQNSNGQIQISFMNGASVVRTQDIATVGTDWNIVNQPNRGGSPSGAENGTNPASDGDGFRADTGAPGGTTVSGGQFADWANGAPINTPAALGGYAAEAAYSGGGGPLPGSEQAGFVSNSAAMPNSLGNVTVWGGAGMSAAAGPSGDATITGFGEAGSGGISFPNETPAAISNVIATARSTAGNTVLTLPDGSSLTLAGISQIDPRLIR